MLCDAQRSVANARINRARRDITDRTSAARAARVPVWQHLRRDRNRVPTRTIAGRVMHQQFGRHMTALSAHGWDSVAEVRFRLRLTRRGLPAGLARHPIESCEGREGMLSCKT